MGIGTCLALRLAVGVVIHFVCPSTIFDFSFDGTNSSISNINQMENKSDQSIKVRSNIWWPLSLYFLLLLLLFDLLINVFIVIDACDDQEGRKSVTASTNHKDVGSD